MGFGVILVFAGLLLIPLGISSKSRYFSSDLDSKRVTVYDSWSVSGSFEKNRKLTLSISPNPEWGWKAAEFAGAWPPEFSWLNKTMREDTARVELRVNIIDPNNGTTSFLVLYLAGPSSETFKPPPLTFFGVAVSSNDGGLDFSGLIIQREGEYLYLDPRVVDERICGITVYNGSYKVSIYKNPMLKFLGNPIKLELWSEIIVEDRPYLFLVPLGMGVSGFGLASSLWAVRRTSRRRLRKSRISRA